jgi:carbon monoxide dehydrogenase subunit G
MKISGVTVMHAPAGQVWAALTDPDVLAATIPGCEHFEPTGPDSYRFRITAGLAPIQGTYTGDVSLSEQREPSSFVLNAAGAGGSGTVSTSVHFRLADVGDGHTELIYDAHAAVDGLLGGIGQLMLSALAQRMAGEFFTSVDDVLAGNLDYPRGMEPLAAAAPRPAEQGTSGFARGVVTGAGIALGAVALGRRFLGRRPG